MADITQAGPTNGLHEEAQGESAGQAQQKAQEVAGQAQEKAQEVAGQAQDRARTLIDERSTQAGEQVSRQASDLRSVGEQLRTQGKEGPAKVAEQAAQRVESLGSYLTSSDADKILHDVEDLGRRQPWAVALGGLALGFAASRFLKASSRQRFETRSSSGSLGGLPRAGATQPLAGPAPGAGAPPQPRTGLAGQPIAGDGMPTTASPVGSL
jgi:hypothetical protein